MDAYIIEWLNLLIRWLHVITGVAWIGASFYFNWLDSRLETPSERLQQQGIKGNLWAIHGGGFYEVRKYKVAPAQLPKQLHWFKWEAYFTWITGFSLLALIYYWGASTYLVAPEKVNLSPAQAVVTSMVLITGSWLFYHLISNSPLINKPRLYAVIMYFTAVLMAWILTQVFADRAAYIQMGAILGTLMAGNVFYVIIPSQQALVDAVKKGDAPDPQLGIKRARRSKHNNYMTLPVLFIMISHHFPTTYGSEWNWAILAALALIGAIVRHHFNLRNQGKQPIWILPVAALAFISLALVNAPKTPSTDSKKTVQLKVITQIIESRCSSCHSRNPSNNLFSSAPAGIVLEQSDEIEKNATAIYQQTVVSKVMPLGNITGMTTKERELIKQWYYSRYK